MLTKNDLDSAVEAGVINEETAISLAAHFEKHAAKSQSSEEHFRLISGFNDIFVAIAAIILLVAMWAIGDSLMGSYDNYERYVGTAFPEEAYWGYDTYIGLGGLLCAVTAWLLAEYFTRKRRMALPSLVLLGAFLIGWVYGLTNFYFDWEYSTYGRLSQWLAGDWQTLSIYAKAELEGWSPSQTEAFKEASAAQFSRGFLAYALIGLITALVSYLYWLRFKLPASVAAVAGSFAALAVFGLVWITAINDLDRAVPLLAILAFGIGIFAYAMWWDMSDRDRETRRSDIAFWLHLLAAPMIAHPIFRLIGVSDGDEIAPMAVLLVLAIYVLFGLVAIIVDRRALLVSALAYVLIALTALFREFGFVELNVALTALIIGSALLTLSAFWNPIRKGLIRFLPDYLQSRIPPVPGAPATG